LISFVEDRPGHDRRYALDVSKTCRDLGWFPTFSFENGLREAIAWYVRNAAWMGNALAHKYELQRLGTLKS
jgi:dTDP-glucose 4,6-dehydratase